TDTVSTRASALASASLSKSLARKKSRSFESRWPSCNARPVPPASTQSFVRPSRVNLRASAQPLAPMTLGCTLALSQDQAPVPTGSGIDSPALGGATHRFVAKERPRRENLLKV